MPKRPQGQKHPAMPARLGAVLCVATGIALPLSAAISAPAPCGNSQWRKVVVRVPSHNLRPEDIIQGACDVAIDLRDDLKKQKHPTKAVIQDAEVLHGLLCPSDPPNQKTPPNNPGH